MFKAAKSAALAAALCALAFSPAGLQAKVFKMANQGDVVSMDPHSLNESFQLSFLSNVFDALVLYNKQTGVAPGLATEWKQVNPTTWRFTLRKGVNFHDGTPFNADDVVFSFARGQSEGSDVKSAVSSIAEVKKIDDYTVDVVTKTAFPILPETLRTVYTRLYETLGVELGVGRTDRRRGRRSCVRYSPIRSSDDRSYGAGSSRNAVTSSENVISRPSISTYSGGSFWAVPGTRVARASPCATKARAQPTQSPSPSGSLQDAQDSVPSTSLP